MFLPLVLYTMSIETTNYMDKNQEPIIRKTWANNNISNTILVSIPNEFAVKHGIKVGSTLFVLDKPDGILFKKLELK